MSNYTDTQRLDWMIKESAVISEQAHILPGERASKPFFIEWTLLGESQIEMFATPREAIDAAMDLNP